MATRRVTVAIAWAIALAGCAGEGPAIAEQPPHSTEVIELAEPPRHPTPEEVAATRSPTIAIRAVAAADGSAVGGARVRLLPPLFRSELLPFIRTNQRPARESEDVVETDATGKLVLSREDFEASDVLVEADGYVTAEPKCSPGVRWIEAIALLHRASAVEGRVVDATTGEAVTGARVTARRYGGILEGATRFERGSATTDRRGCYRINTLDPGDHVWLQAAVEGKASSVADFWSGAARRTEHAPDLRVAAPAALAGVVVDGDRMPVAGARVVVTAGSVDHVHEFARRSPFPFRWTIDPIAETRTESDGSFRVEGLAQGERFTVYAVAEKPVSYAVGVARVGSPVPVLVLARYARVFVRLLREDGALLASGWDVTAYIDGGGAYHSKVDDDGWVEVAPELGAVGLGKHWIDLRAGLYGSAGLYVHLKPDEDLSVAKTLKP